MVGLQLGVDFGVREDVPTGDAVLVGAVAPAVGVGVGVPEKRRKKLLFLSGKIWSL